MIDIELNACIILVDEIKTNGFARVARPINCINKVKKRIGIELQETSFGVLRINETKKLKQLKLF